MSYLGLFAIGYDSLSHRFDAFGATPQFGNYIESVFPASSQSYEPNGHFTKISTADSDAVVIAADEIVLPSGEQRKFSFWLVDSDGNGTIETWRYKILPVHKAQFGIAGLYYGLKSVPIYHFQPRIFMMERMVDEAIKTGHAIDLALDKQPEFASKK